MSLKQTETFLWWSLFRSPETSRQVGVVWPGHLVPQPQRSIIYFLHGVSAYSLLASAYMWRCRWGLLTCLCPVFCRCSASVHRRKHMGGQWDSPDQEYGSISLLYHLAMMMMMQVVTFLDWIYGCIALMQQLTLIRIHSSEIHWLLFLNYPSQSEQVYNISLCTRLVLYPWSHAL